MVCNPDSYSFKKLIPSSGWARPRFHDRVLDTIRRLAVVILDHHHISFDQSRTLHRVDRGDLCTVSRHRRALSPR
jgi:hypothetical protein